jgi:drug/metabolite transporter (DMT)-like permease
MRGMRSSRYSYWVALVFLGATQGASYVFVRVAVRRLSPTVLVESRLLLGLPPCIAYLVLTGRVGKVPKAWREGLLLGLINAAIPFTLISWGEKHVDAGVAGVAIASVPIFVALLAIKFLPGERVTGVRLGGVLLGLLGVGVLSGVHPQGGWPGVAGTLAVVVASFVVAAANLFAQRRIALGAPVLATAGMAFGALIVLPFALATLPSRTLGWNVLGAALGLGLVSTGFSQLVFYWLLQTHGASRASLVTYVIPVFALTFGMAFLGGPTRVTELVGLALIAAGVALGAGALRIGRTAATQLP